MSRAHPPSPSSPPRRPREARGRSSSASHEAPAIDREGAVIQLRLAIGKDGLGIELAGPAVVACVDVTELVVRLPHVRFPFDVSGGVAKFRHKRGVLERIAVELDARRVARWAEPRLGGLLAAGPCSVVVEPRAYGATFTVHARSHISASRATRVPALAFELALLTSHGDLSVVVHGARGVNLIAPPTTLALRAAGALLGDVARREGSRFLLDAAAAGLARRLLPEAGVRAPDAAEVRLAGSGESDGVLFVSFARGASPAKIPDEATLASEGALLTRESDDARVAGDLERARELDLLALERAPRHPELARRIAEADRAAGGRAEAASATLREAGRCEGALAGELLAEAGDIPSAIAALLSAAERERSAIVAALVHARAAELASDPHDALAWLDAAIARAPRIAELRWDRAARRLGAGRLRDARADFQELEALAHGSRDRHDVLRRAADIYRDAGLGADAVVLYERALLYRPDDPEALAGLGSSLAGEGRAARGAAILAHAIELAEARGAATSWMHLALGRVLGEALGDRPAAVARLRAVPDDAPEAIAARGLEGRLRAQLGDVSGASLAFARMRERAGHEPSALSWLEEAARFEADRGDLHAAQRHLAAAISIAPADAALESRYRALGETLARPLPAQPPPPPPARRAVSEPPPALDDAEAEARVESLTRTLQGDPTNDAVVDELVALLTRLGRSMDLLALLSARLEDAPPERREALLPRHREVLATLEHEARTAGRDAEADLFKLARDAS
ncbi:MAG: hypothetical protein KF819_00275 [Labilithrix sp.]|nr:hypothetical protein [Labilithrix sp.]